MEDLGALIDLHGHAEWVKTIGLTGRNFDSYLIIKLVAI